jgi:hypothetical protein
MNKKPMSNNDILSIATSSQNLKSYIIPMNINDYDSIILNNITYTSSSIPINFNTNYFLWCSITNGFVASFTTSYFTISATTYVYPASVIPNLEIRLKNPINTLTFKLFVYDLTLLSLVEVQLGGTDFINIIINCIKY